MCGLDFVARKANGEIVAASCSEHSLNDLVESAHSRQQIAGFETQSADIEQVPSLTSIRTASRGQGIWGEHRPHNAQMTSGIGGGDDHFCSSTTTIFDSWLSSTTEVSQESIYPYPRTREGSGPFQRPLPFKRFTFGPLSLYDLRRRLGVPQDLGVFERYSDLAWFAAGKSADSMHILQQAGFFPEFGLCVTHSPPVLWEAKLGRLLNEKMQLAVFDLATLWDRSLSGTTMVLHIEGTTAPNTPTAPEYLLAAPRLEARLAVLQRQAEMTGGPPPKTIDVVAKATAEAWEEMPTFMRAALHPRIDGTSRRFGFHRACIKRPRHSYDGGTCVLAVPCTKNISKEKIT
ncbi:hypothetical protein B0H14DRAFT_2622096 [Mycena olivaceomarginata]|nr:hypothetical protein B0H14DRAFT_2622096 [Mycena olivaceomarginata]